VTVGPKVPKEKDQKGGIFRLEPCKIQILKGRDNIGGSCGKKLAQQFPVEKKKERREASKESKEGIGGQGHDKIRNNRERKPKRIQIRKKGDEDPESKLEIGRGGECLYRL